MTVAEKDVDKPRYHHGDLRAALLHAAEVELEHNGIEAFSLRKVAKRAGVSHAAPAHHFGDVSGLLTALAVVGNRRFIKCMAEAEIDATDAEDRLVSAMCEDGLCCAFSMDNRCNVGRGVSPEDGRQLALNLAVYAMTH